MGEGFVKYVKKTQAPSDAFNNGFSQPGHGYLLKPL